MTAPRSGWRSRVASRFPRRCRMRGGERLRARDERQKSQVDKSDDDDRESGERRKKVGEGRQGAKGEQGRGEGGEGGERRRQGGARAVPARPRAAARRAGPHAGVGRPVPPPRLRETSISETVKPKLMDAVRVQQHAPGADVDQDRDQRRCRRGDQAAEGARQGGRGAGGHHGAAPGPAAGEEIDRQLRSPRGSGDRRGGHAAWRTDVGVPRSLHQRGDSPDPRFPRAVDPVVRWTRATTRSASRSS